MTCISLLSNPNPVPDLANRLAVLSGIAGFTQAKRSNGDLIPQSLTFFLAKIRVVAYILTCKILKNKECCHAKFSYNKNVF